MDKLHLPLSSKIQIHIKIHNKLMRSLLMNQIIIHLISKIKQMAEKYRKLQLISCHYKPKII